MPILRKFIQYYGPYRNIFYLDMFCALIVSLIDLAFPQILNWLVKGVFTQEAAAILQFLPWLALGLFIMYLIRCAGRYYITYQGHVMGAHMESDMRQDLFDQYQRLSFSYYDKDNTGEMMSKLVSDLFDISELAHHGPENVFISLLKIGGSFVLLFWINVPLTLILIAVTGIMVLFSFIQNRQMRAVFMDNRRKIAGVNASLQDSLAGIRIVKSFANEDLERKKFSRSNLLFLDSKKEGYRRMGVYFAGNNLFQGILFITILVAGGFFVAEGTLHPADLAVYALYINIFITPLETLIQFTEVLQKGYSGFKRFLEVVETQPDILDHPNAEPLQEVKGDIAFNAVKFSYDDTKMILNDVNIEIPAGKTIALVGPSGGGKSTLCNLLPRFYDVIGGSITIDGKDIRNITLSSLRDSIGIVQQDVYMFTGTIRDNIAYGKPNASMEEIMAAAKQANIHEFVMGLEDNYDTFVGERGVRLSGGQKQRLSIARVFLKNPPILILDEATSALDNESERHIQKSLEELADGRTTIIIAHRLSTIRKADEIIVISDDGIVERGDHMTLLRQNGIYAKYYNMQFEGRDKS